MDFASRHIGPTPAEQDHMLGTLGYASLDELTAAALPEGLAQTGGELSLPAPVSEPEVLAELRRIAAANQVMTSMIGLGYYGTITPAVLRRNILEVEVDNGVLLQELAHYHKRRLLEQLRGRLPGTAVNDLRLRAGTWNQP